MPKGLIHKILLMIRTVNQIQQFYFSIQQRVLLLIRWLSDKHTELQI